MGGNSKWVNDTPAPSDATDVDTEPDFEPLSIGRSPEDDSEEKDEDDDEDGLTHDRRAFGRVIAWDAPCVQQWLEASRGGRRNTRRCSAY